MAKHYAFDIVHNFLTLHIIVFQFSIGFLAIFRFRKLNAFPEMYVDSNNYYIRP